MRSRFDPRLGHVGVLLALVLASGLAIVSCGSGSDRATGYPGYDGTPRVVSTAPFEVARPQSGGPTTIPEGYFDEYQKKQEERSTTSTLPPPPTTTTEVDYLSSAYAPEIPPLDSISDICGFDAHIGPFVQITKLSPAQTRKLMEGVGPLLARYGEVAPVSARADLASLQAAFSRLTRVLAANGWDPRSAAFQQEIDDIGSAAPISGSLGNLLGRVVEIERTTCR